MFEDAPIKKFVVDEIRAKKMCPLTGRCHKGKNIRFPFYIVFSFDIEAHLQMLRTSLLSCSSHCYPGNSLYTRFCENNVVSQELF